MTDEKDKRYYIDGLSKEEINDMNSILKDLGMTRKDFLLNSLKMMGAAIDAEAEEPEEPMNVLFEHSFAIHVDLAVTSSGDLEGFRLPRLPTEMEEILTAGIQAGIRDGQKPQFEFNMPTKAETLELLERSKEALQNRLADMPDDAPEYERRLVEISLQLREAEIEKANAMPDPEPGPEEQGGTDERPAEE